MLRKILIYIIIGCIITFFPLYYINNYMLSTRIAFIQERSENYVYKKDPNPSRNYIYIPKYAQSIFFTFTGEHVSYVTDGSLYIKAAKSNTVLKIIKEDTPILYALPLNDRNLILYFTYDQGQLQIYTYDLDKKESIPHKSFRARNFDHIQSVAYSSLTNIIYINAETTLKTNTIYKVDIMKDAVVYASNRKIVNMSLLNSEDGLIFEDVRSRIYFRKERIEVKDESEFKLLGVNDQDFIYLLSLKDNSTVYVLKNGEFYRQINIKDPHFTSVMNRNNKIYLVYENSLLDLLTNKTVPLKKNNELLDVLNKHILYRDEVTEMP